MLRRLATAALLLAVAAPAVARDDGRWAGSSLKPWFDKLASQKGLCCSFADGRSVADPDWGTEAVATAEGNEIRYWVVVDGHKLVVPPDAVVTEPNRYGPAVVWPFTHMNDDTIFIRCFMPGAGT